MADKSRALNSEEDWKAYSRQIDRQHSWREHHMPDEYPCICLTSVGYDERRRENKCEYEFVYLSDFQQDEKD